jgi:hypothetical protein
MLLLLTYEGTMQIPKENMVWLILNVIAKYLPTKDEGRSEWIRAMSKAGVSFYSDPVGAPEFYHKLTDFERPFWVKLKKYLEASAPEYKTIVSASIFRLSREFTLKEKFTWITLQDFSRDFIPILRGLGMNDPRDSA